MTAQTPLTTVEAVLAGREAYLLCRSCRTPLVLLSTFDESTSVLCLSCGVRTHRQNGIWVCLSPEKAHVYEQFVREYEYVRAAEGRGSFDPAYYLALPYEDLSSKMTKQWKIRARTYDYMKHYIIETRATRQGCPLRILDLGAGNGWLSYRLALLGHSPVAIDLLVNDQDGLGAAKHFSSSPSALFPRVQATSEQLPLPSRSFDLAIFNASFHYSEDYSLTLAEAIRCLRPGGTVVIADTPWYSSYGSGEKMVIEKRAHFRAAYGFASCSIASQEFLTSERLNALAKEFNLSWQTLKPFYGIQWALRPLRAKLSHRRTPSHFHIYVAEVTA
jgi:SAM-dependent methyltransferase